MAAAPSRLPLVLLPLTIAAQNFPPPSPSPPPTNGEGCVDACIDYNERDGVCDDGGPGSEFAVCSYGRDCYDCGPRGDCPCRINRQCRSQEECNRYFMWGGIALASFTSIFFVFFGIRRKQILERQQLMQHHRQQQGVNMMPVVAPVSAYAPNSVYPTAPVFGVATTGAGQPVVVTGVVPTAVAQPVPGGAVPIATAQPVIGTGVPIATAQPAYMPAAV